MPLGEIVDSAFLIRHPVARCRTPAQAQTKVPPIAKGPLPPLRFWTTTALAPNL